MTLLTRNSKMKKSAALTYNFGLPEKKTCPFADKCKSYCYAGKGFYLFPNVVEAKERRYQATLKEDFIDLMFEEIILKKAERIRIHDSGDFYSEKYLSKWITLSLALPHVTFYAYTKSITYFQNISLPDNFKVIYSMGGKYDHLINPSSDRHALIYRNDKEKLWLTKLGYIDASDDDGLALTDNKKIMLKFH